MDIRKMLVDPSKYDRKCPYTMNPTKIIVHNTGNDASANDEIKYMITNDKTTSFHIAVDDKEAVQGIPFNRNTWHAGDYNGIGNRQGISIEICYSKTGGQRFNRAEQNASKLIAQLLYERGWSIEHVSKHQDYSGKYCPHRTLDLGWDRFLNMVHAELKGISIPTGSLKYDDVNIGDTIKIKGLYIVAEAKIVAGIYQIRNDTLAGGAFGWIQNGIPERCVDLTNYAGIKLSDSDKRHAKINDYFNFPGLLRVVQRAHDNAREYVKLDFNGNSNYQFWIVASRCYKV